MNHNLDNHANQLNPNNDAYYQSRGFDSRPDNWDTDTDTANTGQKQGPKPQMAHFGPYSLFPTRENGPKWPVRG